MNKIVTKILLTGDKSIPELHLKQPGFTYSDCGPFKNEFKNLEILFKWNLKHLYRNELVKASYAHDAAYFDSKY